MSKILSLDQASRITGYAIFDNKELIDFGKFELNDENAELRLVQFRQEIQNLINKYQPDIVIYEDIQEQNNIQTFKVLAEIYGILTELLMELQLPHQSILASSWKSALGIKGKARAEQKRNAANYVINKYNIKVSQDTADAICIGDCYIKKNSTPWS